MPTLPEAPPVLSTPDTHIFEAPTPTTLPQTVRKTSEEIHLTYEIQRTISEIRSHKWRRIALQFPDEMLPDTPRVFEALRDGLRKPRSRPSIPDRRDTDQVVEEMIDGRPGMPERRTTEQVVDEMIDLQLEEETRLEERLYILADTSYGACCVDEIAAEHVSADVVVHYGRACLSPTARLPVVHVFTQQVLPLGPLLKAFKDTYPDTGQKIILMADVTYSSHVPEVHEALVESGYINVYSTSIVHDPSSPLPNRTVPEEAREDGSKLKEWQLFHISDPPQSLLLTLSSRVSSIHIYPTPQSNASQAPQTLLASTSLALRRRYALLTSLSTVPIFGILINTLSVKNYLHIVEHVKAQILAAGKKSYTFVVGKVNAAKIANFSEVGGWVVIGCWESSLVESKDFWKPVITPFELELALKGDGERIWTGDWRSDFQGILDQGIEASPPPNGHNGTVGEAQDGGVRPDRGDLDSEPESAPPEFNLRTGRYISHTRPMRSHATAETKVGGKATDTLIKRANGDLAVVAGEASPGAEFLRSKRTWKGLGSDFEIAYDESGAEPGTTIEEGRSGIARGYTHGGAAAT
ncbi:Diphthamide biosynthesis protein 2 [Trapelia coarctata]|nr:Diphthamide biosynthesis protein 2 [Trapelia coarctata]